MSLIDATALAAARAFVIAGCAVGMGFWLLPRIRALSPMASRWAFGLGAIAYFTPTMLAGYGWLPTVVRWPAGSFARECFYGLAVFIRLAPIATLALWLACTGPSAAAEHAWRLARGRGKRFWWREAGLALWVSAGLVFLFAFQEFDLATSWGMRSWTVSLFDAQIGGLAVSESLRLATLPLAVELTVIVLLLLPAQKLRPEGLQQSARVISSPVRAVFLSSLAFAFFVLIPASAVFRLGADGFRAWMETPSMLREITHAFLSAGIAAVLAWAISGAAARWWRALLVLPGLLGPLVLALAVLALLQWFPAAADTVVPWLFALVLHLLPMALLLRLLLEQHIDRAALHSAKLSSARAVEWSLWRERAFAAGLLLFCAGYADFTISTLLAPPQFSTVFPRVFNLMHYGQSAVLSFAVLLAVLAPLAAAGAMFFLLRFYGRRCLR
jgi:ABC-type Fe3+ transport system permease subunit